jgi:uncharacterized protein (TIGR02246 family)
MRARASRLAALLTLMAAVPACSAGPSAGRAVPAPDTAAVRAELGRTFTAMADAWNAGDMPGHVAPYADSATMMTGRGPQGGRERIAEMLSRSFWRDGRPLQQLRFEQVLIRPIGDAGAVVTGRFILSGGERDEQTGWFTTVWERREDGWRIVHDHSG